VLPLGFLTFGKKAQNGVRGQHCPDVYDC